MPTPQLLKIIVEKGGAKFLRAYRRQNSKSGPVYNKKMLIEFVSGNSVVRFGQVVSRLWRNLPNEE